MGGRWRTELLVSHGNKWAGALPFTAIFDRNGKLTKTKLEIISGEELNTLISTARSRYMWKTLACLRILLGSRFRGNDVLNKIFNERFV